MPVYGGREELFREEEEESMIAGDRLWLRESEERCRRKQSWELK